MLDRQMHRQIAIPTTERCWAGVLISANDRQNTCLVRHVMPRCWNDNRVDEGPLRLGKQRRRRRRQRRSRSILSFYHPHYDVRIYHARCPSRLETPTGNRRVSIFCVYRLLRTGVLKPLFIAAGLYYLGSLYLCRGVVSCLTCPQSVNSICVENITMWLLVQLR